ncbi:GNAT family N-acetyltransferase [Flavihumibacter sp. UBA7668]|uniref:GNAT family N-acetyltransferase n=1 Tax=Flavihumibacter sp. UBA7668 TaxID=1946542 RepID=UPI0025BD39A3|nr:GNAT family N-acetyltransferase [Flavihumibacter sp. UBA7668]
MINQGENYKRQLFINLPVSNLENSCLFYLKLGFTLYPLFTEQDQICLAWSDRVFLMLQSNSFFNAGNGKSITDTKRYLSASFTIPVESVEQLNKIIETALQAGGKEVIPAIEEVFMQVRTIEDLDGHTWGILYLDRDKFSKQKAHRPENVTLQKTRAEDLDTLFSFQSDPIGAYLAAFMAKDYLEHTAYIQKYTRLLQDPTINNQTIWYNDSIIGSIAKFVLQGDNEITYWIDRAYWGKGIATKALEIFLGIERTRPLIARVAFDNYGSQQVLEKCGFIRTGKERGYAVARQEEIEEIIYQLN